MASRVTKGPDAPSKAADGRKVERDAKTGQFIPPKTQYVIVGAKFPWGNDKALKGSRKVSGAK